jgi:peptidoglycan/xylan/chitin deacetylase (PgdA/CDA1 family)
MEPAGYGPFEKNPIVKRPKLSWPGGARLALWVIPNIEFFALDAVLPGNNNERLPKEQIRIPNVRNWSLRDYGNRVGVWRLMEVLSKHGIRATVALNSDVCDHHPEIVAAGLELGWEFMGHGQTNVVRNNEIAAAGERDAVRATLDRIARATGRRPVGWLGPALAETWNTLDHLIDEGVQYVCDWVNDDQPYAMTVGCRRIYSIPYSLEINDVPIFFIHKCSNDEYETRIRRQFDTLYREGADSGRVMAIALHPFVTGVPHRIGYLDSALRYICSHEGVWKATGAEIVAHYRSQLTG